MLLRILQESRVRALIRQSRHSEAIALLNTLKDVVIDKFGTLSLRTANINQFLGSLFLSTVR